MTLSLSLGLDSFGDMTRDADGRPKPADQVLRDVVEEAVLADSLGIDFIGLGEHHRPDFAISAPEIVLAAIAGRTSRIRLGTAVTVLSTDDPVRVYQQFATLDLLSGGRAELMVGRGSFAESFPLFLGGMPADYDALFAERLELLLQVRDHEHVTWRGRTRPPLNGEGVYPRPERPLPVWLAVGGTPSSARRAGTLGLPMALAIIGGAYERFAPFVRLHRDAAQAAGHGELPLGINAHGFLADTSREAADLAFPAHSLVMNRLGRERGWASWRCPRTSRAARSCRARSTRRRSRR